MFRVRFNKRFLTLFAGAFAMFALVACGGGDDDGGNDTGDAEATETQAAAAGSVDVTLGQPEEFGIQLSAESTAAGSVTFEVENGGALPHEFKVIKSDLGDGDLPTSGTGVDEGAVEVVVASGDLNPGDTESVAADLEAGSYVLICNVAGHYAGGMHVPFTVE